MQGIGRIEQFRRSIRFVFHKFSIGYGCVPSAVAFNGVQYAASDEFRMSVINM